MSLRRAYKGFWIEPVGGQWQVTAQGQNVIPGGRTFETRSIAEVYADLFLGCGGTPFGQDCDLSQFNEALSRIAALRGETTE